MSGAAIPDTTQLVVGAGQTVFAIDGVNGASANDKGDIRVYAGQIHQKLHRPIAP